MAVLSSITYLSVSVISLVMQAFIVIRCLDIFIGLMCSSSALISISMYMLDNLIIHLTITIIELISNAFRSISIGFRYCANAIAGHILMHVFQSVVLLDISMFSLYMSLWLIVFEVLISIVQSSIFVMLISVYL